MITLQSCLKKYHTDQDKAVSPQETIEKVREKLSELSIEILSRTKRIDTGRLGIPVFMSICGSGVKDLMPTRKQMGKGASVDQAEASALMELIERFSFFSFFAQENNIIHATWSQAKQMSQEGKTPPLIAIEEIIVSVHDNIDASKAEAIMDLIEWSFMPATHILSGEQVLVPINWFKQLGEFNGSSAGNTDVESILQGSSELVERHVSCLADKNKPTLPTIDLDSCTDPVLKKLITCFKENNITLILKDMSLGQALPTVAALAYDPESFPKHSEIVFTAGTSSSPTKAAIRAVTEVAQLAGDFCTGACYEASGLEKYAHHEDHAWLEAGELVSLDSLPSLEQQDIYEELLSFCRLLKKEQGFNLYSISTTNPMLGIPANYSFVPGFEFRERDKNASIGLFVGRMICENSGENSGANWGAAEAEKKLAQLAEITNDAHYIAFFQALLAFQNANYTLAATLLAQAEPKQPDNHSNALAAFYAGYSLSLLEDWEQARPFFHRASTLEPNYKEYWNRFGVCLFKLAQYTQAADVFSMIIKDLDKGSATDHANLGLCLIKLGKKSQAIGSLATALDLDPSLSYAQDALNNI